MGNCENTCNFGPDHSEKSASPFNLRAELTIWNREDCGLFDYESTNLAFQTLNTQTPGKIIRVPNKKVYFLSDEAKNMEKSHGNCDSLIEIKRVAANSYCLEHVFIENNHNKNKNSEKNDNSVWIIVKYYNENKGFRLITENVIKLGRTRLKLIEHCLSPLKQTQNLLVLRRNRSEKNENSFTTSQEKQFCCRICLSESAFNDDVENPFISPCQCSGSMKFIHWNCLCKWMRNKMQINDGVHCLTLLWKNFKCELCKSKIPGNLMHNNRNFNVIEAAKPTEGPYAIFEILGKKITKSKGIHILCFKNKNSFKMGRGPDCDLRLTDISVSRVHATLSITKGNDLLLCDNKSKFGTLVLMKNPLNVVEKGKPVYLQSGKIMFKFSIAKQIGKEMELCCRNAQQKEENVTNVENYDENIGEELDEIDSNEGGASENYINHHMRMEENF